VGGAGRDGDEAAAATPATGFKAAPDLTGKLQELI